MTPLDQLQQIIPQDQALANKALAVSLQGITGIASLSLPHFANAVANVQTTTNLPLISALTQAVSTNVANIILSTVGTGTGQDGTIQLDDILGTAAGAVSANVLINATSTFSTMSLTGLISVYGEMANTVNGVYGNPTTGPVVIPSGPQAGTYANAEVAFSTSLIPAAQVQVANVVATNPTQAAELNSGWTSIMSQLGLEQSLQAKANLNFTQLTANNTSAIYDFVFALPSYGQDTTVGGAASFIQSVANLSNFTGQSIVATMRQGQTDLTAMGIGSNDQVPSTPNPAIPQATLLPAQPPYPGT